VKIRHLLVYFILVSGILGGLLPGYAQEPDEPTLTNSLEISFKDLIGSDLSLQGLLSGQSVWVDLPYNWTVENDIILTLNYYASEELDPERASLTVLVNGTQVTSIQPINDGEWQTETFAIPSDLVYQGAGFLLEFQGYLRVSNAECEEQQIPSQWFKLGEISRLALVPDTTPAAPVLDQTITSLVPVSPFLKPHHQLIFVLPSIYDRNSATLAAQIAARIGRETFGRLPTFLVRTPNTLTEEERANASLVVVGTPASNPLVALVGTAYNNESFVTLDGTAVPENDGVIAVVASPWNNNYNMLIASGLTSTALQRVSQVMGTTALFNQLNGWVQYVGDLSQIALPAPETAWVQPATTFAQLGFQDRTNFGTGSGSLSYVFQRPNGYRLAAGSQLILDLAFSPLSPGSHVAIYLNGAYVGTAEINREVTERQFSFDLPVEEINRLFDEKPLDPVNLQIAAVNMFPSEICQQLNPQAVWSRINAKSAFTLETIPATVPDLGEFPYPYLNLEPQIPAILVLPDALQSIDLEMMLLMAMKMGRAGYSDFNLRVLATAELSDNERRENLIVFGEPARQTLTAETLASLNNSGETTGLYNAVGETNAGIIRQVISPFDANRVMTLVYGDTPENYAAVAQAFANPELLPAGAQVEWSKERIMLRLAE